MLKGFLILLGALMAGFGQADAAIQGAAGTSFTFTAKAGQISTAEGNSVHAWGYANAGGEMQYPGPTLIVKEGDTVTVTLDNQLAVPVSIVFPGQEKVTASGGQTGKLTREVMPGGQPVSYSFTAGKPGTYLYHSGTRPDIQVDMGLVGALIVRPANFSAANRTAYGTAASGFDHEYLFLLTEMDPLLHERMARDPLAPYDISGFFASYWFVNGRTALDTVVPAGAPWLPSQPYNIMPRMNPGQRTLLRVIGGGRDIHPYHTHGNNTVVIARDGRLLESAPGATLQIPTKDSRLPAESFPDLSYSDYTIQVEPGATYDAIFRWTGAGLGWDIHGHAPGDPCLWQSGEDCSAGGDHGKPLPVDIPGDMSLSYGKHYGGSTFLGSTRQLPPGTGNVNMDGGLFFMWHSHTEKEMTNYNVFPGGMMTMMIIEPPSVQIPE